MHKLLTISCYFGTLPEHFPEFLRSAAHNPTVDFLLVTDAQIADYPANVKVLPCTFSEIRERLQALFDFPIVLDRPYKLCDYRPAWGLAFQEFLTGYDFWGHCDMDMIFGDIRKFLPDEVLENYDKIYKFGHLTYYRNTAENNERFKLDNWMTYTQAFSTRESVAFDEIAGMQNLFDRHGFPTYFSRDYADITYEKVRFALTDFHVPQALLAENNYDQQLFYWENGRVFRAYVKNETIMRDEFNYIHFSRRKMTRNQLPESCSSYFITNKGLFERQGSVQLDDFARYNPHEPIPEFKRSVECRYSAAKEKLSYYWGLVKRKLGR